MFIIPVMVIISAGICVIFTDTNAMFEIRKIYRLKITLTLVSQMLILTFDTPFPLIGSSQPRKCKIYSLLLKPS